MRRGARTSRPVRPTLLAIFTASLDGETTGPTARTGAAAQRARVRRGAARSSGAATPKVLVMADMAEEGGEAEEEGGERVGASLPRAQ